MPGDRIYCVLVGKGRMNPHVANYLFDLSQNMVRTGINKSVLRGEYNGIISTEGQSASFGSLHGQVFHARVEGEDTDMEVSYTIRPGDLRSNEGSWYSI